MGTDSLPFETVAFNTTAYSYLPHWRPAYSLAETLERVAGHGFDAVEIGACRPHALPSALSADGSATLRERLRSLDLAVVNVCSHFPPLGLNLAAPDPDERAAAREYLVGVAELAADLDAPYFHVVPGWSVGSESAATARERAVGAIDRALAAADYGDATPLIEPLRERECDVAHTPHQALAIADDLSVDANILLDTFQLADELVNPVDAVRVADDRLGLVHLADTDRRPPGEGAVPWELVFDALADVGFDGPASVEIWGDQPDELARASLANLAAMAEGRS